MATATKIGPAEHGRPLTFEEFVRGDYEEGHRYELINGRLYVSPAANLPENCVEEWLRDKSKDYARPHAHPLERVVAGAGVFIPGQPDVTCREPDVAAYRRFPVRPRIRDMRWQDISPVLVAEVLSADDPGKDLFRSVVIDREVPSIKEYWIVDARKDANYPSMKAYRRRGKTWRPIEIQPANLCTAPLLTGFRLVLNSLS